MRVPKWLTSAIVALALLSPFAVPAQEKKPEAAAQPAAPPGLDKAMCLGCHGNEGFAMPDASGKPRALHVQKEKFEHSVHGKRECVECHKDITAVPHQKAVRKVSCVSCHEQLWEAAQREGKTAENARLGMVVDQIARHLKSVHAQPNREDQSYTNATCYDCHDPHYVYPRGTPGRAEWRLNLPNTCGKCHTQALHEYLQSVHADEAVWKRNPKAAVCSDCHTGHDIQSTQNTTTQLGIIEKCGACHIDKSPRKLERPSDHAPVVARFDI